MEYLQEETRLLATPTILPAPLSEWRCLDHDTLWKSLVFTLIPHLFNNAISGIIKTTVSPSVLITQY